MHSTFENIIPVEYSRNQQHQMGFFNNLSAFLEGANGLAYKGLHPAHATTCYMHNPVRFDGPSQNILNPASEGAM